MYTERDVRREVEAAKTGLEHGSDWQKWVSAMRRLAGVALGGGGSEFPALLVGLVRASVHEMVGHKASGREKSVVLLSVGGCKEYSSPALVTLLLPLLLLLLLLLFGAAANVALANVRGHCCHRRCSCSHVCAVALPFPSAHALKGPLCGYGWWLLLPWLLCAWERAGRSDAFFPFFQIRHRTTWDQHLS